MTTIAQSLLGILIGAGASLADLTLIPPSAGQDRSADYLTLDEALESNFACITEVSEGGSVPEIRLERQRPQGLAL
ncbi:MAG: hypothetical protein M3Q32_11595 [Pseudomonadota bacterium]|nr:hypothetical protein [Burkholderiales bacterium]MDQ3196971.1 hypothetical protein [Pseudomonadota bacterium]